MSKTPPALRRIQHVGLKVHDLGEAVAFYRDVMGLQVSDRYEPGDNPHSPWGICFMRCGEGHHEVSLIAYPKEAGLAPREGDMRAPEVGLHHVAFEVGSREELEAWAAHVRSKGIKLVAGPLVHSPTHPEGDGTLGENRAFYFHDPCGNGIEIFCDMARIDAALQPGGRGVVPRQARARRIPARRCGPAPRMAARRLEHGGREREIRYSVLVMRLRRGGETSK